MTKQSLETIALGAGVVLSGIAALLLIPKTRSAVVDLVDDYVPQIRRVHPKEVVTAAGNAAAMALLAEARREWEGRRKHSQG